MKKWLRILMVAFGDIVFVNAALVLALYIHYEGRMSFEVFINYAHIFIVATVIKILIFYVFSLYSSLWEYASIEELINVVGAVLLGNALALTYISRFDLGIFFGVYLVSVVFEMAFVGGYRFSYRVLRHMRHHKRPVIKDDTTHVLIIGSGATASFIASEIKSHPKQYGRLVGFIGNDETVCGKSIAGVKVLGSSDDIYSIVKRFKVDEIVVAIPTATQERTKQILNECKRTGAKVKIVPGIQEVIDGRVTMKSIRDVGIEDLLGRDVVNLNIQEIASYLKGKVIMVTGGGGSIGSELCRQISRFEPSKLVIVDIYENNAYEIQNELLRKSGNRMIQEVLIANVCDRKDIRRILSEEKPQIVFHAAAHKHVPLMERSPKEAIKNNILGTLNVVEASHEYGVEHFVFISTDKAVNPTSIMGATKRMCEMIIQSMNKQSNTVYTAVRFGNVLGSNGSVVPLFKKQISEGGPVTVTHKDITRYFMTIEEAAQLVIQAGAIAKGGEIFVLNMGKPIRIYDLAEDLIRLSGLRVVEDIKIEVTGLRPGEKLFEEPLMAEDTLLYTKHEKIFIGDTTDLEFKMVKYNIEKLEKMLDEASDEEIKARLSILIPTYNANGHDDKSHQEIRDDHSQKN